jgi:peroxiredoxin
MAFSGVWFARSASHDVRPVDPSDIEPRHPVTQEMASAVASLVGKQAPAFSLPDQSGKLRTLEELCQGKPLFLYFILDGCPCSTEAEPQFHRLYKLYKGSANFAGIIASKPAEAKVWATEHEAPYTILADPAQKSIKAYKALHSVYSVLIRPDGSIDRMWAGYSQDMLKEASACIAVRSSVAEKVLDVEGAPKKLSSGCAFVL